MSTTSAGTKLAITAAVPATRDAAGYAALTYTVIGGIESIPAVGAQTSVTTFQPLDGPTEKLKGPTNYGSLQLPYAYLPNDAGQTILRTAAAPNNNAEFTCKETYPDGSIHYFSGRAFGNTITAGGAGGVLMGNTTFEINYPPVLVPAP